MVLGASCMTQGWKNQIESWTSSKATKPGFSF